ncbi:uncharacterized protein ACNLHF_006610 isoform 2-T2 [Anomaloglossus baeobatrachus]|uniref:uncharacterized protein LOC142303893 isoform X2 n=1 Tax=Anomaloglossus baeobatrachus TaxID=238106 RepID=UPI003F500130
METPTFLLLLLFMWPAAVNPVIRKHEIYRVIGSSVTFPPIKITEETFYDFKKLRDILILNYHGIANIRPPYIKRVNFMISGEIELRNLTEDDSGTYEQVVNMRVVAIIYLHVIEPVIEPTLWKVNETIHGDQCHVFLECHVQGSGPLNVTFLKDGEEISENITTIGRSRFLSVDSWDPGSHGSYTCKSSNPLGVKTSSQITVPTADKICKRETSVPYNWTFIVIVIIIIIIAIFIGAVVAYKKCRNSRRRNPRHNSAESGDATEDTSQLELQRFNRTSSGDGRGRESSCSVSMTAEGESGGCRDEAPEDPAQLEHPLLHSSSAAEGEMESSCNVPTTDDGEPGEDTIASNISEPPPQEEIQNRLNPGQCGKIEASALDPELSRASTDHGHEAVD